MVNSTVQVNPKTTIETENTSRLKFAKSWTAAELLSPKAGRMNTAVQVVQDEVQLNMQDIITALPKIFEILDNLHTD